MTLQPRSTKHVGKLSALNKGLWPHLRKEIPCKMDGGVLVCAGCYDQVPWTAGIDNRNSFLTVLRLQVQDQGSRLASSGEDPLLGSQMVAVLLYPYEVERESSGLFLFL